MQDMGLRHATFHHARTLRAQDRNQRVVGLWQAKGTGCLGERGELLMDEGFLFHVPINLCKGNRSAAEDRLPVNN